MLVSFLLKHLIFFYIYIGIDVEHFVAHVHTQNGIVESFIKRLQLIADHFLSNQNCLYLFRDMLYAASLVKFRSTVYHKYSPLQLIFCVPPNIFHLQTFSYAVNVPIMPPPRTKMDPQYSVCLFLRFKNTFKKKIDFIFIFFFASNYFFVFFYHFNVPISKIIF